MTSIPNISTTDLRLLQIETSKVLQAHYTFKEIAELFYRSDIISAPENPYPAYEGNKYDYAMEKLSSATDLKPFLSNIVPEIFGAIDAEWANSETQRLTWAAEKIGYKIISNVHEFELPDGSIDGIELRDLVPPDTLLESSSEVIEQRTYVDEHESYPRRINELISELNTCLSNNCYAASALLIRRIIFLSCAIYAQQNGHQNRLLDEHGDYRELSKILAITGEVCPDVSSQLIARVQATKWMGDYANHNKNWSASKTELDSARINLHALVSALYHTS